MGIFHVFLNCTNGTKSRKAQHIRELMIGTIIWLFKLRFEKMLDVRTHTSIATDGAASNQTQQQQQEAPASQQQSENSRRESMKEKTKFLTSSVAGLFTKLNKKDKKKVRKWFFN